MVVFVTYSIARKPALPVVKPDQTLIKKDVVVAAPHSDATSETESGRNARNANRFASSNSPKSIVLVATERPNEYEGRLTSSILLL